MKNWLSFAIACLILGSAGNVSAILREVEGLSNQELLNRTVGHLSDLVVEAERLSPEQASKAKQLLWQAQIAKEERDERVLIQMWEMNLFISELQSELNKETAGKAIKPLIPEESSTTDWWITLSICILGVLLALAYIALLIYGICQYSRSASTGFKGY